MGSKVLHVTAVDADEGPNSAITYSMIVGPFSSIFVYNCISARHTMFFPQTYFYQIWLQYLNDIITNSTKFVKQIKYI